MKKNYVYAMIGAIALTGAVGLTSCTDEDIVDVNPGYNSETGEVPVNFVFNVSKSVSSTTRMNAANTQANLSQIFRGIDNAYLMAVKLGTSNDGKSLSKKSDYSSTTTTGEGEGATTTTTYNSKIYELGTVMSAQEIAQSIDDQENITGTSHRIIELSLPTETNALLFWGKAIKSTDDNADHDQGKVKMTIPNDMDLDKVQFRLCRVVPDDEPSNHFRREALLQYEDMISAVLTQIIRSEVTWTVEGESTSHTLGWVDYIEEVTENNKTRLQTKEKDPANPSKNMNSLGEILGETYCTFNTIYEAELRAGSGSAIAHMMSDLRAAINKVKVYDAKNDEEKDAVRVATVIVNNIDKFFDSSNNGNWKVPATIVSNCGLTFSENLIQDETSQTGTLAINNFPTFFHLPKGATILEIKKEKYTEDTSAPDYDANVAGQYKKDARGNYLYYYQYKGSVSTYAMGGTSTAGQGETDFNPQNYMYPPELCYFGNSPIRVTDDTHSATDYPNGPQSWTNEASWAEGQTGTSSKAWETAHVLSTTRSVAMRDNINYGTALLETTIRYNTDKLEDNNAFIQNRNTGATEDNNVIDVSAQDNLFKLTGILVGGQEAVVGWNYIPVGTTFGAMVYDRLGSTNEKFIPKAADSSTGGNATSPVYTLVWDNWEQANVNGNQRTVYLALEFENRSGVNFWGQNNLIRNGETFYITGKLDPDVTSSANLANLGKSAEEFKNDKSLGISWPADITVGNKTHSTYALPPYDEDGNTIKKRRVFIQDYKTTANFVISTESLQHALVAVPDLRSSQISLGLSVDLSWSKGLTFDDIELGKE